MRWLWLLILMLPSVALAQLPPGQDPTPAAVVFNPACNGALVGSKDVGGSIQAALNTLVTTSGGRGTLSIVDTGGCYSSTMITVPKGITLHCADSLSVIQPYETSSYGTRPCSIGGPTGTAAAISVLVTGGLSGIEVVNPNITAPTSARSALTTVAAFAGTGVLLPSDGTPSTGGQDALIQNVFVYGFAQCFDGETIRPWIENFGGDCTNGLKLNGVHDVGHITQGHFVPYLTVNQTWAEPVNTVTAVASNGGLVQLTIPGTVDIEVGDLVNVRQVGGRSDLNNRWTVSAASQSGGNTLVTLTGSSFGTFTFTGNLTVDNTGNSFYIQSASSTANLAPGQVITDSDAAIQSNTTITWFNKTNSVLYLSQKATSSETADTFTVTPGTFTSGGSLILDTNWRHGKAWDIEGTSGSQQTFMSNLFAFYFDTCWYFGLNSEWMTLSNIGCDTAQPYDPTTIAFDLESNTAWNVISNSVSESYGTVFKVNSTNRPDATLVARGSNQMEGLNYAIEEDQGTALVDGEIVNAGGIFVSNTSGSNLEYIGRYPLSGVTFGAPAAFANFAYHPIFAAQMIGIGPGAFNPQFPLEIANQGSDTNPAIQIESSPPITGFYDNNLTLAPTVLNMNRHTGSTGALTLSTSNTGSWGGGNAGAIIFAPNGVQSLVIPKSGGPTLANTPSAGDSSLQIQTTAGAMAMLYRDVQTFTTPGTPTWTKPAFCGYTGISCLSRVRLIGAGGGGGGGGQDTLGTAIAGGGSGGDGACLDRTFPTSLLGATATATVGSGGTSGNGATAGGNGTSGGVGGASGITGLPVAGGGGGGGPGQTTGSYGGSQGGVATSGNSGSSSAAGTGSTSGGISIGGSLTGATASPFGLGTQSGSGSTASAASNGPAANCVGGAGSGGDLGASVGTVGGSGGATGSTASTAGGAAATTGTGNAGTNATASGDEFLATSGAAGGGGNSGGSGGVGGTAAAGAVGCGGGGGGAGTTVGGAGGVGCGGGVVVDTEGYTTGL